MIKKLINYGTKFISNLSIYCAMFISFLNKLTQTVIYTFDNV